VLHGLYTLRLHHEGFFLKKHMFYVHKLVALAFLEKPEGIDKYCVNHIDRNTLNNNVDNLRFATLSQAQAHKITPTGKCVYRGVEAHIHRWPAIITMNNKKIYLGSYKSAKEAARAYNEKARELFGEFANLNYISDDDGQGDS
jgi:hypothetical protein